jgi:hypothetical protein
VSREEKRIQMIRMALKVQIAGMTAKVDDADSPIRLDKPLFNWTWTTAGTFSRNRQEKLHGRVELLR